MTANLVPSIIAGLLVAAGVTYLLAPSMRRRPSTTEDEWGWRESGWQPGELAAITEKTRESTAVRYRAGRPVDERGRFAAL